MGIFMAFGSGSLSVVLIALMFLQGPGVSETTADGLPAQPLPTAVASQTDEVAAQSISSVDDVIIGSNGEVFHKPEGPGFEMGSAGLDAATGDSGSQDAPKSSVDPVQPRIPGSLSTPFVATKPLGAESMPLGLDVSGWQDSVDWASAWSNGARFAFVKASEGPWASNQYFAQQFAGAAKVGIIRGAYSFALPKISSGASQATALVLSGGGWAADGMTLPGVLDLEYDPDYANYGTVAQKCYSMSPAQLVAWTADFNRTYLSITGRYPIIYANYSFWQSCMGNTNAFNQTNPLWIAAYGPPAWSVLVPGGWSKFTIWQFADSGVLPGDQNVFNGTFKQLQTLAGATFVQPLTAFQQVADANPGLGTPIGKIVCGLASGGCMQQYQFGDIYKSPSGFVTTVGEPFRKKFVANGGVAGSWGYPVSAQSCGLAGGICRQDFDGGSGYFASDGVVRLVPSKVLSKWAAFGAYGGSYGFPTTELRCGFDRGGCLQDFSGGSIYINPQGSAVAISGPMRQTYWAMGGHAGVMGYPASDIVCGLPAGGCLQNFETGSLVQVGAGSPIAVVGDMNARYAHFGGPIGGLGHPLALAQCGLKSGGCRQEFSGGSLIKSSSTGVRATTNPIRSVFDRNGGITGVLGYPMSDQVCGMRANACMQDFQGGSIYITPTNGAVAVVEPVRLKWWQSGGQSSPLGYPAAAIVSPLLGGGSVQEFDHGSMIVTPSASTYAVSGRIREQWWQTGAHAGTFGYPVGDQQCSAGKCSQRFAKGTITG